MLLLQNAYSTELSIDPTPLMVVDPMHDVELGVGKAVITHTFRLLLAAGDNLIEEFDARSVPQRWQSDHQSDCMQLSASPYVRSRHDKEVWRECFVTEEDDRKGFRGHHSGWFSHPTLPLEIGLKVPAVLDTGPRGATS